MNRFSLKVRVVRKTVLVRAVCAAIAALSLCKLLPALEPSIKVTQLDHAVWTRQDARLLGGVLTLAQTTDGYLWIGTEFGLLRFDGVRFQPWLPPNGQHLSSNYIVALTAARDGSLWIGTRDGLTHWVGDTLETYHTSKGTAGPVVTSILEDHEGQVWAGTAGADSAGLCRVVGKFLDCDRTTDRSVLSLFEDRQASLWSGGTAGLCRRKPAPQSVYALQNVQGSITSIIQDWGGVIWIATNGLDGLFRLADDKLVPYRGENSGSQIRPHELLSDRDSGLWIGTAGQGIAHLAKGRMDQFTHADGLSNNMVRCLFEDREGNIWAGTDGGLDRFRELPVPTVSKREGLAGELVTSVFASKAGGVWVGMTAGLDRIESDGTISHMLGDSLPSASINGLFEEQGGRMWVGSNAGLKYLDHGRLRPAEQILARTIGPISSATEDRDHIVWFSSPQGLARMQSGQITEILPWTQFENKQALALEADPNQGGIWLGFSQGGIAFWKQGQSARWYSAADGLASGGVMDLRFSHDGALWIATQTGLSRLWQGHIATLGTRNGLPCELIHDIVEDNEYALWLNTACGLVRITASDLASWSKKPERTASLRVFDASDGMWTHSVASGYFRRATKSTDGRLWFNVLAGVAEVNPRHLALNPLPPPVQIERITADRNVHPIKAGLRLPPLTRDLEIEYTALSFVDPEKVHFRYKLEGSDSIWHEAGGRRQAAYTNLPPKHYQFRVIASNNDGVWNEKGAVLDFFIPPAFYQTRWFELLCVVAAGLILWVLYRLRLRQIAARLSLRFEERIAERSRIARELHDNLLQNISGVALQLEGLSKTVTTPPSAKDRLRDLREQAEQWLHEARETVWDLRSPPLEGRDFLTALRETGEQITGGKTTHFHMRVIGSSRRLPEELEGQLLRIVREAIRNAVLHGQSRQILVEVAYLEGSAVEVEISDDGCGFILEEGSHKMGHWGLAGMQERAQQIGAELKIATSPGSGTRISITVPAPSRQHQRIQHHESAAN